MKRSIIIIMSLMVFMLGILNANKTYAQVFITDEDYNGYRSEATEGFPMTFEPEHDSTLDWTPIGNGIWLLGCLCGAYLLGKRRKEEDL